MSLYPLNFPSSGLKGQVEGEYERALPFNDQLGGNYVTISKKNETVFTWKYKEGVEWDLTLDEEESNGELRLKVGIS